MINSGKMFIHAYGKDVAEKGKTDTEGERRENCWGDLFKYTRGSRMKNVSGDMTLTRSRTVHRQ